MSLKRPHKFIASPIKIDLFVYPGHSTIQLQIPKQNVL